MSTQCAVTALNVPDVLRRLVHIAERSGGAAYIYHEHNIVLASNVGRNIYPDVDWERPVTFDDCFWAGIRSGKNCDPYIMKDPEGHLAAAKIARSHLQSFRFSRRHDNTIYDRHHLGLDRAWNGQLWLPTRYGRIAAFTLTPETSWSDVNRYLAQDKALDRMTRVVESAGYAVAVLDQACSLVDYTPAMMRMFGDGGVLSIDPAGVVMASSFADTAKLAALVADIAEGKRRAAILPITTQAGERAVIGLLSAGPGDPHALLLVLTDDRNEGFVALLADAYGLSPAEALVAVRMSLGKSPKQIADESGRSVNTILVQMKAARKKIGAGRHDFVNTVTKAAAMVGGSPP